MDEKVLYIVRHAKSSWKDPALKDFDRPLNKRGKRDAPMMAEILRKKGISPDLILSSPAKRARKTAKAMHTALGGEQQLDERLYDASLSSLHAALQAAFATADHVMLVGHNPEITQLNNTVSTLKIYHIPTAAVVAITLKSITPLQGDQRFYEYPKKYRKRSGEKR